MTYTKFESWENTTLPVKMRAALANMEDGISQGISDADAAKKVADAALPKAGGTMTGPINMGSKKITNLDTPAEAADAANKSYVDAGDKAATDAATAANSAATAAQTKADAALPKAGGTMTGPINMGSKQITNMAAPTADAHAATKKYVDDAAAGVASQLGSYLPTAGGSMSGPIDMNSNKITKVPTPQADTDAANKKYVDDTVSPVSTVANSASATASDANTKATNAQNAINNHTANTGIHVAFSTNNPAMDGTAAVGTAATVSRSDHVHPTDTSRQATITGGATTITSDNLTTSRALVSNSSGKVAVSDVTSTELGYLDGVTSPIQTQLNTLSSEIAKVENNIETGAIAVDTTLSVAGMAADAKSTGDAITKLSTEKLPITGGTMTGSINMSGNKVTGLGTPESNKDAVNLKYAKKVGNPYNFLDNSDFRNPVNQRGVTSFVSGEEGIDRWKFEFSNQTTVSLQSDGLHVEGGSFFSLSQTIPIGRDIKKGDSVTFVLSFSGTIISLKVKIPTDNNSIHNTHWNSYSLSLLTDSDGSHVTFKFAFNDTSNGYIFEYAAVYKGEYDGNALPAYQPKGYAVELAACNGFLRTAGDTMTGNINMNGNKVTGLDTPTSNNDAVNLEYAKKVGNPYNLLDNSDFRNPVNQRNVTAFESGREGIDRWVCDLGGTFTAAVQPDGIHFKGSSGGFWFKQTVSINGIVKVGAKLTMAVKKTTGLLVAALTVPTSGTSTSAMVTNGSIFELTTAADGSYVIFTYFGNNIDEEYVVEWEAVYEGEYTADTLPAYQPKGYAVELAACNGLINANEYLYHKTITSGQNILALTNGLYSFEGNVTEELKAQMNLPVISWHYDIIVTSCYPVNASNVVTNTYKTIMCYTTNDMYINRCNWTEWQGWKKLLDSDDGTAGALPVTGGTMRGWVYSNINGQDGDIYASYGGWNRSAYMIAHSDNAGNIVRQLYVRSSASTSDISEAVTLNDIDQTTSKSNIYKIYGEHNKPLVGLAAYPVGSIYISYNATSPAALFGGTWTQIADRFLLAAGNAYAVGTFGGEAYHTLTVDEMPSHQHVSNSIGFDMPSSTGSNASEAMRGANMSNPFGNYHTVSSAGGGAAHNNMPPYLAVYMWYRTA